MNPLTTLKTWMLLALLITLAVVTASLGVMTKLYLDKRDEVATVTERYNTFAANVAEQGKQAQARADEEKRKHQETINQVRSDYEKLIPSIRNDAVAQYRAIHPAVRVPVRPRPGTGSGPVPDAGSGDQVDDGTGQKCVLDEAFIRDAADDAAKVGAWQEWCLLNSCPVQP